MHPNGQPAALHVPGWAQNLIHVPQNAEQQSEVVGLGGSDGCGDGDCDGGCDGGCDGVVVGDAVGDGVGLCDGDGGVGHAPVPPIAGQKSIPVAEPTIIWITLTATRAIINPTMACNAVDFACFLTPGSSEDAIHLIPAYTMTSITRITIKVINAISISQTTVASFAQIAVPSAQVPTIGSRNLMPTACEASR